MPTVKITINRRPEKVWQFFVIPQNWQKWHERAVMCKIEPGWQDGAKIVWAKGPPSTVRNLDAGKKVEIESPYMTTAFEFSSGQKGSSTLVKAEFASRGGATFSEGGMAHQITLQQQLYRLKELVEAEIREDPIAMPENLQLQGESDDKIDEPKKRIQKKWYQFWK